MPGAVPDVSPDAVLDAIADKSGVDVERAIAAFRPWRPPVERVRRVVEVPRAVPTVPEAALDSLPLAPSAKPASRPAGRTWTEPATEPAKTTLTSAAEPRRRVAMSFTIDESDFARFERAKAILSRKHPRGATIERLFVELVDFYLEKNAPKQRAPKPAPRKRTRHIPAATRDHVMHRDGMRCAFVAADGTRCAATHDLQVDHVVPWVRGGTHDAANLRVLCGQHNRRRNQVE